MNKAMTATIAVAVVAAAAWFFTRTETPTSSMMPGSESALALNRDDGALAEVKVPETFSALATTGKAYYDSVCAACHGANGQGQDGVAPPLVHKIYEPSHHGEAAFMIAPRNGVRAHHWPFGNMPPVQEKLTDAELKAIIQYVRELQKENGIY